jgi:hypothetical protein
MDRWIDGGWMLLHATVFGAKRKNVIGGTSHDPNLKVSSMFHSQSVGSSILSRVMEAKNGRMQESDTVSVVTKKSDSMALCVDGGLLLSFATLVLLRATVSLIIMNDT